MAAEYIAQRGNLDIVLCERGIRTFETATRNTLDISAVPVAHALSHLPVIVDPSHSGGRRDLVVPLSRAAIAVGADGIIVDVHPHPEQALCDGPQALVDDDLRALAAAVRQLPPLLGRRPASAAADNDAEHASRALDVVVADVEVGDHPQVPPVEQADQHALLAAAPRQSAARRPSRRPRCWSRRSPGRPIPAPPRRAARPAAGPGGGRRPAGRRGGPARAARPPPGCPTWRIPPPSRLRQTRASATRSARRRQHRPDRRAEPLGQADRHGVEQPAVRRRARRRSRRARSTAGRRRGAGPRPRRR